MTRERSHSRSHRHERSRNDRSRSRSPRHVGSKRDRSRSRSSRHDRSRDEESRSRSQRHERSRNDRSRSRSPRHNRSRDEESRRHERSRSRYRSRDRSHLRRERSISRKFRLAGITRDKFERQKGILFSPNYDIDFRRGTKDCDKCGSWLHNPWKCGKYEKYSLNVCKVCDKKLHHVEEECKGDFRDKCKFSYNDKLCEELGISIRSLEIYTGNGIDIPKFALRYVGTCRKDFDRKLSDKRCEKCGDRH